MRPGSKKRIEEILRDYPNMARYIHNRKLELMYPIRDVDQNVGGGKSTKISKPQETMIVTIDDDKRLKTLEKEKRVIAKCLTKSDDDTRTLIRQLFFIENPIYTVDGLIFKKKINCSRTEAFRLKNRFFDQVARGLDLYDPY